MLRFIIYSLILTLLIRALLRLWAGIREGLEGAPPSKRGQAPLQGVQMVRDPVCGTFVVPARAIAGRGSSGDTIYFCSAKCRDQHAADAAGGRVHGRTA